MVRIFLLTVFWAFLLSEQRLGPFRPHKSVYSKFQAFTGDLTIVRRTLEPSYRYIHHRRGGRRPRYNITTCQFAVYLESEYGIPPEGFITVIPDSNFTQGTFQLIPETHSLPGAVLIKDFRSFGYNRRTVVETMIFSGAKQLVKLTQNYRPMVPGLTGRGFLPAAIRDRQHVNESNICPVSK